MLLLPEEVGWLKTSDTGRLVFEWLTKTPATGDELVVRTAEHYGLPKERVEKGVLLLLEGLVGLGMVEGQGTQDFAPGPLPTLDELGLQQVWLHLTKACNFDCSYCYVDGVGHNREHMPLELAQQLVTEAEALGVFELVVSGGEPFLHPRLEEFLTFARDIGSFRIKVLTNGSLPDKLTDCILASVDDIQVSVDGTRAEIHDELRGRGSFEKIVRLFERLEGRNGLRCGISFTPHPSNADAIPSLGRLAQVLGADYIHLNRPKPAPRWSPRDGNWWGDDGFARALKEYDSLLEKSFRDVELAQGFEGRKEVRIDVTFDPGSDLFIRLKRPRCAAGILTLCVDPGGDTFPCSALCRTDLVIGNAFTEGLEAVATAARQWALDSFDVDDDPWCRACHFRYFCGGGCRATAPETGARDGACTILMERFHAVLGAVMPRPPRLGGGREDPETEMGHLTFREGCSR